MIGFSVRSAFALAVALLATGCSNPVGPASSDPVGPAFSLNPSASNSGKQKCETTDAAFTGALNMIKGVGMFDPAMMRAADQGNAGMMHALGVSMCPAAE